MTGGQYTITVVDRGNPDRRDTTGDVDVGGVHFAVSITPTATATVTATATPTDTASLNRFSGLAALDREPSRASLGLAPLASGSITRTITYSYDDLYRLTDADYSTGEFYEYAYEAVGNRTAMTDTSGTTAYTYDDANRPVQAGSVSYNWDDNGNLLSDGTRNYTYDSTNRPTQVQQGASTYTLEYDGLGNRRRQTVDGAPTTYALDVAAGLTQVLGDGTNAYLYGLGRIGAQTPAGTQYHHGDAVGSLRLVTGGAGGVAGQASYSPFGVPLPDKDASSSYGFAGEWTDATGLVHLRARSYAPAQGRFVTRYPFAGWARVPASLHDYQYGYNNPVRYTDPYDRFPWETVRRVLPDSVRRGIVSGAQRGINFLDWYYDRPDDCECRSAQPPSNVSTSVATYVGPGAQAVLSTITRPVQQVGRIRIQKWAELPFQMLEWPAWARRRTAQIGWRVSLAGYGCAPGPDRRVTG